jgi:hypothetical protein
LFKRSFNPNIFENAFMVASDLNGIDPKDWLANKKNCMYVAEDGSVGLLTFDYPGTGTVHWFFKCRGRAALTLAKEMLNEVFENEGMQLVRGITPQTLPAARWAVRQLGFTSHGFMEFPNYGLCEVFTLTKEDFYKGQK